MSLTEKVCLLCREALVAGGTLPGFMHQTGAMFGPDGHTVTPVDQQVADRVWNTVGVS